MIGKRLSHFRIVSELGRGGMGVVYLAIDENLRRQVALKVLPQDALLDRELRHRFLREARSAAAVTHSRIAVVHEIAEVDNQVFIAMEYVIGQTLRSLLQQGLLETKQALSLAIEITEALVKAHEAGIVHRDLKPENIMVDGEGHAKVLDFGLAKQHHPQAHGAASEIPTVTENLTAPGTTLGTPAYMSPEQIKQQEVDSRSDLFALGITVYEMLSGKNPFRKGTYEETLGAILHETPAPIHKLGKKLPRRLNGILQRCLRKEAGQRYDSARELLRDLQPMRHQLQRRAWVRPLGVGLVVVVIGFTFALVILPTLRNFIPPRAQPPPAQSDVIAVLPFSYRGSADYEYLAHGLMELVASATFGIPDVRTVDDNALVRFVDQEGLDAAEISTGRSACARFGAGSFVQGSVVEAGNHLRVRATLYDAQGVRLSEASNEGSEEELFSIVDGLVRHLMAKRLSSSSTRLSGAASMSTESLPALKAYLEGERLFTDGEWLRAQEAFTRAVAADTTFALAYYRLALLSANGSGGNYYEYLRKALRHQDRLNSVDAALLEGYSHFFYGEFSQSVDRIRFVLGKRPDDAEAWFILGETLFVNAPRFGMPPEETRYAYERACSLNPRNGFAIRMLMRLEAREGNYARVDSLLDGLLELEKIPEDITLNRAQRVFARNDEAAQDAMLEEIRQLDSRYAKWAIWIVAIHSHNLTGAIRIANLLSDPSREAQTQLTGHLDAGMIELARGRWEAAGERLAAATEIRSSVWLHRAVLTMHPGISTSNSEYADILKGLTSCSPQSWRLGIMRTYLLGLLALQLQDSSRCNDYLDSLSTFVDTNPTHTAMARDLALCLRAHRAWDQGHAQQALDLLVSTKPEVWWIPGETTTLLVSLSVERYLRGLILERLGRDEEALNWYGGLVYDGHEIVYRAPAHFRRGAIYEKLGQFDKAREHYQRSIDWWKDCDPELRPLVDEARSRLAALKAATR
jgi:tetratricopeptide (TPR) repeat protein/predicted Ser/Thr protein kinase